MLQRWRLPMLLRRSGPRLATLAAGRCWVITARSDVGLSPDSVRGHQDDADPAYVIVG